MIAENYLESLKKTGLKITTPRKQILQTLSSIPMSAQEIQVILKEKGLAIDLVTVYRTLELFENLGLIRKTEFEDHIARFELVSDEHHHHLVCIKCGITQDVVINENKFIEIEKQSEFKLERHALEFFGFCKLCQH